MKRTLAEALQTASKMKQELPSLIKPEAWAYDLVKLGDAVNVMFLALQTMADPMAEIPKAVCRDPNKSLGDYYEELATETLAIVNGKYERK